MNEVIARELICICDLMEKALMYCQDKDFELGKLSLKKSLKKLDELLQSEQGPQRRSLISS